MKKTKFWSFVAIAAMSILTLSSFKGQEVSTSELNIQQTDCVETIQEQTTSVLKPASFPGGEEALLEWMNNNMKYPTEWQKSRTQGAVIVSFAINKDGTPDKVGVISATRPELGEEVVRVVKSMPNWEPATYAGKPVGIESELSFTFLLPRSKPEEAKAPERRNAWYRIEPADTTSISSDKAIVTFDENAYFPGGERALMEWMSQNMQYPPKCQEQGVQGQVIVSYVIERDGSLTDIQVVRSPDPDLSAEGVRIMKSMPKWVPAKQNGKPVRSRFNLPIRFRLG